MPLTTCHHQLESTTRSQRILIARYSQSDLNYPDLNYPDISLRFPFINDHLRLTFVTTLSGKSVIHRKRVRLLGRVPS